VADDRVGAGEHVLDEERRAVATKTDVGGFDAAVRRISTLPHDRGTVLVLGSRAARTARRFGDCRGRALDGARVQIVRAVRGCARRARREVSRASRRCSENDPKTEAEAATVTRSERRRRSDEPAMNSRFDPVGAFAESERARSRVRRGETPLIPRVSRARTSPPLRARDAVEPARALAFERCSAKFPDSREGCGEPHEVGAAEE